MNANESFKPITPPLCYFQEVKLFVECNAFCFDQNLEIEMYMEELVAEFGSEEAAKADWDKSIEQLENFLLTPGYTFEEMELWVHFPGLGYPRNLHDAEANYITFWQEVFEKEFPTHRATNRDLRSELGLLRRKISLSFKLVWFDMVTTDGEHGGCIQTYPAIAPLNPFREYEEEYLREEIVLCQQYLQSLNAPAPQPAFKSNEELQETRMQLMHRLFQVTLSERQAALESGDYPDWFLVEVKSQSLAEKPEINEILNHTAAEGRDVVANEFFPAEYIQWLKTNRLYERVILKKKRRYPTREEMVAGIEYERGISTEPVSAEVTEYLNRASDDEKQRVYSWWLYDLEAGTTTKK
jgi:hypothetical protein